MNFIKERLNTIALTSCISVFAYDFMLGEKLSDCLYAFFYKLYFVHFVI